MVSYYDISHENLVELLKEYVSAKDYELNNFDKIIERAEVDTEWNDVKFVFNNFAILLNISDLSLREAQPNEPIFNEWSYF